MARKRLLTILAGAVAVVGLQAAPGIALDLEADLSVTKVEASISEDGVEAKLGDEEDGEVEAKVSDDGVDAKVGDTEVSTKETTEKVKESTDDGDVTEEKQEKVTGGETTKDEQPSSTSTSSDGAGSSGGSSGSSGSSGSGGEVTTAGDAAGVESERARPDALDPDQARRFLPRSGVDVDTSGPRGDVTPAFDLSGRDDLDDPLVAAPPESGAADWERVSPNGERSDAELAAIPAGPEGDAVPAGLKLVAALLVAGTGTVWHLTRRELATKPVRAS